MKAKTPAKNEPIIESGITIRETRPGYYMIDHMRDGKRERQCFRSLEEAKSHCIIQARKISNEGSSVLDLTPTQREDAKKAIEKLKNKITLDAVADYWLRHNGLTGGVLVNDLGRRWIVALRGQGCRETTMVQREHKTGLLCRDYGSRTVGSMTRDDFVNWMDSRQLKGSNRDTYRRCYHAMFRYAVDERMIEYNPVSGIKPMRMDERLPVPFTVDQSRAILTAAATYAPIMLPTLAVQLFAGLRPGEAMGLDWSAIDFKEKIIRVHPETSKVRRSRLVEMTPALIAWLTPYRKASGTIGIKTPAQFGFYMSRKPCGEGEQAKIGIIKASGVKWIKDGPRKTFASMHYAIHQDAGKLAAILGHTGGFDVLYRHYRGLMKKTEATRYWKLRPVTGAGKVIQLSQVA